MEIGVSPLVPSCNRVTVDTATLTITFADTIDREVARRDMNKTFELLTAAAAGTEVEAIRDPGALSVCIGSRPGCDEDVAGDEAIEIFSMFVRQSFGEPALQAALANNHGTATVRIRAPKPSPAAAMATKKAEIARLITKLQEQVDALPNDSAKWANVGDAGHIVEQLQYLTQERG